MEPEVSLSPCILVYRFLIWLFLLSLDVPHILSKPMKSVKSKMLKSVHIFHVAVELCIHLHILSEKVVKSMLSYA